MVLYEEKIYRPQRTFGFQNCAVQSDFILSLSYTLYAAGYATPLSEDKKKSLKKSKYRIIKTILRYIF